MIPGWVISILTFPGVIIHEWAHKFFCNKFGVRVYEVVYFQFGNPAGYVRHEETDDYLSTFMIGVGPFLVNSIIALLVFSNLRFLPENAIYTAVLWLGVSIGAHAFPSTEDASHIWELSKEKWRSNPLTVLGLPVVLLIHIADLLSFLWFDFIYSLILFQISRSPELFIIFLTNPKLIQIFAEGYLEYIPFLIFLLAILAVRRRFMRKFSDSGSVGGDENESHGTHWDSVTGSIDEVVKAMEDAVENAFQIEEAQKEDRHLTYFFSEPKDIHTVSITEEDEIITSYPIIEDGTEYRCKIESIEEWENGVEALIQADIGPSSLKFFDTLYSIYDAQYFEGKNYSFVLSGLCLSLEETKGGPEEGLTLDPKNEDKAEYSIKGEIKDLEVLEFRNKVVYKLKLPLFKVKEEGDYSIKVYASEQITGDLSPEIGDTVKTDIWLQGYLMPREEVER